MTCWSDLASDVLECITSFLPLSDYHRFSAVCKNWRLVANQKRYSPTPQLPWLVLGDEPDTRKRIFYNLSEDKHYAMDIPELYGRYICGSSHGWLVAIDINITGILINPFTREFYELPLFPQYDIGMFGTTTPFKNVPTDYRNGYRGNTLDRLQVTVVHKAILSHDPKKRPDFTVMILTGLKGVPAFWKPGDSSWNVISVMKPRIHDVIYLNREEQFIFVTVQNEIFIVDFKPDFKLHKYSLEIAIGAVKQSYLVNCFGYLLFVVRWHQVNEEGHCRTKNFEVIRPDFEKGEAYGLDTFDDHALFLGKNDSTFIDVSEVPGCNGKTDSIYFTDAARRLSHQKFKVGWDDMGIFNMSNKTFETFYSHEIHHTRVGVPIWLTPNPW